MSPTIRRGKTTVLPCRWDATKATLRVHLEADIDSRRHTHGWDPTIVLDANGEQVIDKQTGRPKEIGGTEFVVPLPGMPSLASPGRPNRIELDAAMIAIEGHWLEQIGAFVEPEPLADTDPSPRLPDDEPKEPA